MAQIIGGLTRQQVDFFNSKPWGGPRDGWPYGGWVGKSPKGEPYISGAMIEAILTAGFGPGGWSMEVLESKHEMMSPFAGKDRQGGAITIYTVLATAKVRIIGYARNPDGFLLPGVEACHFDGADAHAATCHQQSGVGSIVGNAIKGAITRAMRSAASRVGPVTGRDVMRGRDDGRGKKYPVENFVSEIRPALPEFPCVGDGAGAAGFDAKRMMDEAAAAGGDRFDYDEDGDAYDPHSGVVQQPAAQQAKRAPVEPAHAPVHQSAPAQQRQPTPPPAAQPAQQSEPAQAPVTSRPAWMSAADAERIANNDRIMRDDGKPWVVSWTGPDGKPSRAFVANPDDALAGLPTRLNMPKGIKMTVRLRAPDDAPVALLRWPDAPAAATPEPAKVAPAVDRVQALNELRAVWNRVRDVAGPERDHFGATMMANGLNAPADLRTASDEAVQAVYAAIIGSRT